MPSFECSVSELNGNGNGNVNVNENVNGNVSSKTQATEQEETPKSILSKGKQYMNLNSDLNSSLFSKLTEEKNVRIILLVVITYLITNSTPFTELLGNSFPYLVDAGVTNLSGKIVISIIIGASIVLFTSFFQAP